MKTLTYKPRTNTSTIWQRSMRRWQLYVMLVIPFSLVLIFNYFPMFGIQIAFKNFQAAKGIWGSDWVGFLHFKTFFKSFYFDRVVRNTIIISLYSLVVNFPLQIIFALLLNTVVNARYKKLVQTVTYMPHFISMVVLVGMVFQFFNNVSGIYGWIYRLLNEGQFPKDLFSNAKHFIHFYIWSGVWQELGWGSVIYFAALSAVDPQLHDAAQIDGASRFKRVIHVDIPAILPTASIILILSFGGIMSVGFEKIYLMQNNINLKYSEVISTYVYKVGMSGGAGSNFSYATAIGLFNSVINGILLVIVNTISKKLNEDGTSLW